MKTILFRAASIMAPLALILALFGSPTAGGDKSADAKNDPALERTRKQVRMLDDIYKGAIVAITTHYVKDKDSVPAGTAFKKLFEAVEKKGWHKVRLLDATGEPYNDENAPEGAFETQAIKALVAGKPWYEEEINKEGKRYLQAATPIPVVMKKCVMCHENYADLPKERVIGALSYTIPIE